MDHIELPPPEELLLGNSADICFNSKVFCRQPASPRKREYLITSAEQTRTCFISVMIMISNSITVSIPTFLGLSELKRMFCVSLEMPWPG